MNTITKTRSLTIITVCQTTRLITLILITYVIFNTVVQFLSHQNFLIRSIANVTKCYSTIGWMLDNIVIMKCRKKKEVLCIGNRLLAIDVTIMEVLKRWITLR